MSDTPTPTSVPAEPSRRIEHMLTYAAGQLGRTCNLDDYASIYSAMHTIAAGDRYAGDLPTNGQRDRASRLYDQVVNVDWTMPDLLTAELDDDERRALRAQITGAASRHDPATVRQALADASLQAGARVLDKDTNLAQITAPDGRHTARYQQPGRFAELRRDGTRVRVFDRGDYHSNVTAFGCAFALDAAGRPVLVVSSDWDALSVYDPATGEQVAGPFGDGDPFIGRIVTDPTGRYLAYDAWAWHPVSYLQIVAVDDLLTGQLGVSCGSAVDYLFDRPMCWVTVGQVSILASLGVEVPDDRTPDGTRFDAVLQVELHDVNGQLVATLDVADAPAVTCEQLATYQLTNTSPGVITVTCDGADVARLDVTAAVTAGG